MSHDHDDSGKVHETILPTLTLSVLGGISATEVEDLDDIATPIPGLSSSAQPPAALETGDSAGAAPPADAHVAEGESTSEKKLRRRGARRGDIVGNRYIVEGQIGRGGMGRVLKVRHQVLGKPFALKLIKAPIANKARIREMFYREARLASALTHDNICSIVDFGEDDDFGLFMVMELLEGKTVHGKISHDGRFAPKVACDIMWQVVEAVRYIHGRAIVHGDIKSENILLSRPQDRRRMVKLLDFGLARAEVGRRTEKIEGTPEYLAPERIRDGVPASPATDIYALGILFYELLTGELPFRGSVEEIFRQHVEKRIPKVGDKIEDPYFDERADDIIARATAPDPADRHPDATNLLYELRTLMNMLGMDVSRRRPGAVDSSAGASSRRARVDHHERGGSELFDQAPVPLASITDEGKIRVANSAFLEFIGVAGDAAELQLADSGFTDVYPALLDDVASVLHNKKTLKRIIYLSEGGGAIIQVAVVLHSAANTSSVTAGDVHMALHPLARLDSKPQK